MIDFWTTVLENIETFVDLSAFKKIYGVPFGENVCGILILKVQLTLSGCSVSSLVHS